MKNSIITVKCPKGHAVYAPPTAKLVVCFTCKPSRTVEVKAKKGNGRAE